MPARHLPELAPNDGFCSPCWGYPLQQEGGRDVYIGLGTLLLIIILLIILF
jgi:hypothetical protein